MADMSSDVCGKYRMADILCGCVKVRLAKAAYPAVELRFLKSGAGNCRRYDVNDLQGAQFAAVAVPRALTTRQRQATPT